MKLTIEIKNLKPMLKNHKIFSTIGYDVHYHIAKSQIKIQLVYGETKMTNCIMKPNS
jgi:hypothetical protein